MLFLFVGVSPQGLSPASTGVSCALQLWVSQISPWPRGEEELVPMVWSHLTPTCGQHIAWRLTHICSVPFFFLFCLVFSFLCLSGLAHCALGMPGVAAGPG